jgi:hypothetical protein
MAMNMRIQPEAEYLFVEISGPFELGEAQTLSLQYLEACIEHQLSKVVVDTYGVTGQLTINERFRYADFVARQVIDFIALGRLQPPQLAYVGAPPILDPEEFGVLVALSRGVSTKTARTVDQALAWLGVAPPGPGA